MYLYLVWVMLVLHWVQTISNLGFNVIGFDKNKKIIKNLKKGKPPFLKRFRKIY